jgi:hypothetical protein
MYVNKKVKKQNKKRENIQNEKVTLKLESSENKYPEVLRCKSCMKSHTPFRKFCKWSMLKKAMKINNDKPEKKVAEIDEETIELLINHIIYLEKDSCKYISKKEIFRLRGGAGNGNSASSMLVTRAIESAKKHGINMVQGTLNKADGNCAFDAVINNINHRQCFSEKLSLASEVYRQIWVTELEMASSKYQSLGAGYTNEEKAENWNCLKQSGIYEIDFFGDLVMHAIAKGCHKNILIFNTSLEAADPIYVIRAEEFGGLTDSDIPVVVGYNQVHYESLHPISQADIEITKLLVNSYISGNYEYKKKDISHFKTK